jgi:hypothetical protein
LYIREKYIHEYINSAGMQDFLNALSNYPLLKGQQTNLYKCFLPNSWDYMSPTGACAFVHPNGVFDDPNGGVLRKTMYHYLAQHFQFQNEMKLFAEVGNRATYSLNIYHPYVKDVNFVQISNLFSPETIDECFTVDEIIAQGIKTDDGNWNVRGNKERIIFVGYNELLLFARLFDDSNEWESARLPQLHLNDLVEIFSYYLVDKAGRSVSDYSHFATKMWDETNAQKDGLIIRNVHFSNELKNVIFSGPHIGVANPIYKTSQRDCSTRRAFDEIDLEKIPDDYIQRTNYIPGIDGEEHFNKIPETGWGIKYNQTYRVVSREMANISGERTLFTAIIPPGTNHINTIYGICFMEDKYMLLLAGQLESLPYDFFVKATGKGHVNNDLVEKLPLQEDKYTQAIVNRVLMLNCLNKFYADIWNRCSSCTSYEGWAKKDYRLKANRFDMLSKQWEWSSPLRSDFERRQALIEIDVLVAMSMGFTLDQLLTIYRIQFPVLRMYEDDTWYDNKGRIVFTNNRSLTGTGFDRKEWERISDSLSETFELEKIDDTLPTGQYTKKITYTRPFDKCDREKDYEEVWHTFEERFAKS